MTTPRERARLIGWWTGWAASICGQRFIITWIDNDLETYEIKLPNGKYAEISRGLPEAITT